MTPERAEAYGRIVDALEACFGSARVDEVGRIREACDALVFARSESLHDRYAMSEAIVTLAELVERGCIGSQLATAMVDDIGRCAPPRPASPDDDPTTTLV
jgi:hypothetical protein